MKKTIWFTGAVSALLLIVSTSPQSNIQGPRMERTFGEARRTQTIVGQVNERYTVRWTADANGPVDIVELTTTATGRPNQVQRVESPVFPVQFSIAWLNIPVGTSITTRGCARVKRRTLWSTSACSVSRTYTISDSAPPPPTVDTTLSIGALIIKPDAVTLPTFGTQQFCAFIRFRDGKVAMRAQDGSVCSTEYTKLPASVRTPNMSQQVIADTTCLTWKAIGGSITASTCDIIGSVGNLQRYHSKKTL